MLMETASHSPLIAPAPWTLQGQGYILLYRFKRDFLEAQGFLGDFHRGKLRYALGAVMLVDYQDSNVGPYKELLFIPGMFDFAGKKAFSITKIYVSSADSVYNGIENWGIPKELADFKIENTAQGITHWQAAQQGKTFFDIRLKSRSFSFPITTSLLPFTFYHPLRGQTLITKPSGKGKAYWSSVEHLEIDAAFFPDFSQYKPLAALQVQNFVMKFPPAKILA